MAVHAYEESYLPGAQNDPGYAVDFGIMIPSCSVEELMEYEARQVVTVARERFPEPTV